jgi:hypothetical protein
MSQFGANGQKAFEQPVSKAESDFTDKEIDCIDCGQRFIWTSGEQLFFRDKGLQNPPKRCKPCKQAKNERLEAIQTGIKQRIEVAVHCANCNAYTTVPFYPSQGRPVYCRSCFLAMNPDLISKQS